LRARTWRRTAAGKRLLVRIGIAHGPVRTKRWPIEGCERGVVDYFGNTVNVASRLESHLSARGGLAVTPVTHDVMGILNEQPEGAVARVTAVEYRAPGDPCDNERMRGLQRSARAIPFSMSCRSTAHLKNVKPFKALAVALSE
jgi:class 3 adenylate cyclase